jgi:hypothetical protein
MKLEDIKFCHVCKGSNLKPIIHTQMDDLMTNTLIYRDILLCLDCDTVHYIDEGAVAYEFLFKIGSKSKIAKEFTKHEI